MTRVGEIKTHNRLVWSFGSAKLGLVGFGCISGSFKFAIGGGNLARFWPKSSQISTNLAESIKIWPIFLHILRDLAEISLYLSRSSHYISGFLNLDLLVFHRNTRLEPRSHYICQWMFTLGGLRSHYICRWSSHQAGQVLRFLKQSNWDSNQSCRRSQPNHRPDRAVIRSEIIRPVGFVELGGCWITLIWVNTEWVTYYNAFCWATYYNAFCFVLFFLIPLPLSLCESGI